MLCGGEFGFFQLREEFVCASNGAGCKLGEEGDEKRNTLTEFNSNNTKRLTLEETKAKIASLQYIQEELAKQVK